jgi:tetratricopeptide (TPR) repeat protein
VAGYTVALYLLHTIYPLRLSCLYSFPVAREIFRPQFLLAAFLIGVLIIAVIFSKKHTRRIIFGSFFFLIIIIPILQLIPFGSSIASDRHAYIALFGLFFLAGVSFDWLYRRRFKYRRVVTISLTIYLVASFLALSYLSWQRCKIWKDGLTLWTDVLKKYPDSPIAYNNRGLAYHSRGEYEKAIADFSRALSITPNYIQPLLNRALLYALKGDFDLALSDYSRVIEINPRFGQAYVCRALIYVFKKDYARARNDVNRAIGLGCKVDPELARGISENTCK